MEGHQNDVRKTIRYLGLLEYFHANNINHANGKRQTNKTEMKVLCLGKDTSLISVCYILAYRSSHWSLYFFIVVFHLVDQRRIDQFPDGGWNDSPKIARGNMVPTLGKTKSGQFVGIFHEHGDCNALSEMDKKGR